MKIFFKFGILLPLPFLIFIAVNIFEDPAHLIKLDGTQSDEYKIARILLSGQQVMIPAEKIGFDERLSRRIYLENKTNPDTSVLFGSSRVRYFSRTAFNEKNHFVNAVNAATLEDMLVFAYLREKIQVFPKNLIIALEPWMIEKANSYVRLVQMAYADAFTQAVDHFGFSLPAGSQVVYKNESAKSGDVVHVPMKAGQQKSQQSDVFQEAIGGISPLSGNVQVSFDAMIESGTYYWAWRILVNGSVFDTGNYMDSIKGSPSPHEYRTMVTKPLAIKEGDTISIELAHASGDGKPVPRGSQQYKVTNFMLDLKCSDPSAAKFRSGTDCFGFLQPERLEKFFMVGKEMMSPAYFQQSLKKMTDRWKGTDIVGKSECTPDHNDERYVFCDDGSAPWPLTEKYDSGKVESIVRTVDDGLVPLKEVDLNALELLKQITQHYQKNGTIVEYLLIPVHPYSYEKWAAENDSRGFVKAEKIYRDFAKANGVPIAGSYVANAVGCKNTDFRDWVHPLPRCTNLLVSELRPRMDHGSL